MEGVYLKYTKKNDQYAIVDPNEVLKDKVGGCLNESGEYVLENTLIALRYYMHADEKSKKALEIFTDAFFRKLTLGFTLDDFKKYKRGRDVKRYDELSALGRRIVNIQEALYYTKEVESRPEVRKK